MDNKGIELRKRYDIEKENDISSINKEKIEEHWQLRKKHNQNIIMTQRKKRILFSNQILAPLNNIYNINKDEEDLLDEDFFNEKNSKKKYLLAQTDLQIQQPLLTNISNNIKLIFEYLSVDDFEKHKYIILSLRIYFEKNNPPYTEYAILFQNNINKYFEILLNRYQDNNYIYITNEILFIITNFFDRNEIIRKYPKNYFKYFLTEEYFSLYTKLVITQEEELINSVLYLLRNIITNEKDLINETIHKEYFIRNIVKFNQIKKYSIDTIQNLVSFFFIIIDGLKNREIKNIKLFYSILEIIFKIYIKIDSYQQKDLNIIKLILKLFQNSLTCKAKDEKENEDYIAFNYLFNVDKKDDINFAIYFNQTLLKNYEYYFSNNSLLNLSLDLLGDITYNSTYYQIGVLIHYKLLDILNNILSYISNLPNNGISVNAIVLKILNISDNIIDSGTDYAKIFILSKIFENLIFFFKDNLSNNNIVFKFINTFFRLLSYNNRGIADYLFKRGIIKDGVFDSLLIPNYKNYNNEMILNILKVILKYLETMFDLNKKNNGFSNDDYILCYQLKEIIKNELDLPKADKECLLSLDFMTLTENDDK